jgi:hypothetical protein
MRRSSGCVTLVDGHESGSELRADGDVGLRGPVSFCGEEKMAREEHRADPVQLEVLWVRHCQSCSNIANPETQPAEKYDIPPLCTPEGMRQALRLSLEIDAERRKLGIGAQNVRFFCSYLPRAMMTAALAASAYYGLQGGAPTPAVEVQVLCHLGELENDAERAEMAAKEESGRRGDCTMHGSESISTRAESACWAKDINDRMESLGSPVLVRMPEKSCAASRPRCGGGLSRAWQYEKDDYSAFVRAYIEPWLKEAEEVRLEGGSRLLYVIVSHGAYIKQSLFPGSPAEENMANTAIARETYMAMGPLKRAQLIAVKPATADALVEELRRERYPYPPPAPEAGIPGALATAYAKARNLGDEHAAANRGAEVEPLLGPILERWYAAADVAWNNMSPCNWQVGSWRRCLEPVLSKKRRGAPSAGGAQREE